MARIADVVHLRSYGDDHQLVRKVLDTTVDMLRDGIPHCAMTTRMIADRAGIAHSELRMFFRSTNAIIAQVYLDLLRATPLDVDIDKPARARVSDQFSALVMLLADEPAVAAACSSALICDEPSVRSIRRRIHAELRRRVRAALRSDAWPEVAETLEFGLLGALVNTSCGTAGFRETADELAGAVAAVLPDQTP